MTFGNVKWARRLTVLAALSVALAGSVTANAATPEESQASAPSSFATSGGEFGPLASWGEIVLHWSGKTSAYATMKTYAGTAYYLYAKVSGTDGLGSIPSSSNYDYDTDSVTTGVIFSRTTTDSVTWDGYGEIQDTSTSGTQTATISRTIV
ncbi:hypothetical protein [Cohnella sp.]|uniref:hypothetical protein n=1 Tax=Cohnella sp. TaxID=1883426 RepID=UPI0025803550|nr:hypothetical protein [Cohnella sp.]